MLSHHKALPSAWLCDPGCVGILAGTHPSTVHCVVWSGLVFLSPSAITGSQPGKSQPEVILHSWMPHLRARLLLVTLFIHASSASGLLLPASSSCVILTELSSLFQTLSSHSSSSPPPSPGLPLTAEIIPAATLPPMRGSTDLRKSNTEGLGFVCPQTSTSRP